VTIYYPVSFVEFKPIGISSFNRVIKFKSKLVWKVTYNRTRITRKSNTFSTENLPIFANMFKLLLFTKKIT